MSSSNIQHVTCKCILTFAYLNPLKYFKIKYFKTKELIQCVCFLFIFWHLSNLVVIINRINILLWIESCIICALMDSILQYL